MKQRLCDFNSRFNSAFRNFKSASLDTFLFLFDSYCFPDYGENLWDCRIAFIKQAFKCFENSFSNAFKKIIGVPAYSSSHITADICNHLLLKYHVALIQFRYLKRLLSLKNNTIRQCSSYIKSGYFCCSIGNFFKDTYDIDIWEQELDIVKARILWVQRHEQRRGFCHFYKY